MYHTYQSFIDQLYDYAHTYPDIVTLYSYDNYMTNNLPIYHIILSTNTIYTQSSNHRNNVMKKKKILLSFGEHARELITVESALDIINNITSGYRSTDCTLYSTQLSSFILNNYELHILPLVNPSGKLYLQHGNDMCYRNTYPHGVDINRNFAWHYGGTASSNVTGNEEYRGPYVFSTSEAQLIKYLAERYHYTSYMSVHSGARALLVPYVDSVSKQLQRTRKSTDHELYIAQYIYDHTDGWYDDVGIGYVMNDYSADGTAADWMAGVMSVPYIITSEIYGDIHHDCFVQFNSNPSKLQNDLDRIRLTYIRLFEAIAMIDMADGVIPNVNSSNDPYNIALCQVYQTYDKLLNHVKHQFL